MKNRLKKTFEIFFPIALGLVILAWVYKDTDLGNVKDIFLHGMSWKWMTFSLMWGIAAQVIRGIRWELALKPLGEHPQTGNCIYSIFISYLVNLVIPRIGEVSRCGILKRYDDVSFGKSLGTVIVERCIDTACILLITLAAIALQPSVFMMFFDSTGVDYNSFTEFLGSGTFYVSVISGIAVMLMLYFIFRKLNVFNKIKDTASNIWSGIKGIRNVDRPALYIFYTAMIWFCYFMHFYTAMFCFDFSHGLDWLAGLVMFVAGSIAVVVPTPNGAGPWHFAIISIMTIYGVSRENAGIFALITHSTQTFLLVLLGLYGLILLPVANRKRPDKKKEPITN